MPQKGEIWKVKVRRTGRIWLFESDRNPDDSMKTRHNRCVCIYSNGSASFRWRTSNSRGSYVCANVDIEYLRKATENEIELFKKIMS